MKIERKIVVNHKNAKNLVNKLKKKDFNKIIKFYKTASNIDQITIK